MKQKSGVKAKITHFCSYFVSRKLLIKKISKYLSYRSDNEFVISAGAADLFFYQKKWFDDLTLHEFEGHDFLIFKDYDSVLRSRYGDYMELPPIDLRKPHHLEYFNDGERFEEKNEASGIKI